MKIHFQKRLIKMIAFAMSAIIIISTMTVNVQAAVLATTGTNLSLEKVIDMALTKTGIVANNNFLQKTQASILNMLNGTASSFSSYCEANGLDKTEETWSQYLSSDAYISLGLQIPNAILQVVDVVTWMISPDTHSDEMAQRQAVVKAIADTTSCVQGETYSMSDESVEFVRDTFCDVVEDEGIGYYYVNVYPSSQLKTDMHATRESYDNCKKYIDSGEYPTLFIGEYSNGVRSSTNYYLNNNIHYYYYRKNSKEYGVIYTYDESWIDISTPYLISHHHSNVNSIFPDIDSGDFESKFVTTGIAYPCYIDYCENGHYFIFYGKEASKQIIFSDINAMKDYSVGIRPYYATTDDIYDNSVDNSINFTGDYIINNADKLSYDTVYNEIVNQNDYSENVVNNIVNDNTQTIINNYYYTDPDGGGDSGDNEGSGGGLGALIDGIGSVLNFIVTLIGDALTLVTSFLDTIYTMLKNLGGSFTNFSGLLGELFTFIPQELIDLISASISVTIAVCLICLLKR